MTATPSTTKAKTPEAQLSYPHLHEAQAPRDGKGKAKFSCTLVFAPGTDLTALLAAAAAAGEAKYPGKSVEMFRTGALKSPFRKDAEAKGYADGSVFLNVRTEQQPGIVYAHAGPDGKTPAVMPTDKIREEMYPGAFVRATLAAFAYDTQGNKGVSFALNNIQKIREGDRLDGRAAATSEFDVDLSAAPASLDGLI